MPHSSFENLFSDPNYTVVLEVLDAIRPGCLVIEPANTPIVCPCTLAVTRAISAQECNDNNMVATLAATATCGATANVINLNPTSSCSGGNADACCDDGCYDAIYDFWCNCIDGYAKQSGNPQPGDPGWAAAAKHPCGNIDECDQGLDNCASSDGTRCVDLTPDYRCECLDYWKSEGGTVLVCRLTVARNVPTKTPTLP